MSAPYTPLIGGAETLPPAQMAELVDALASGASGLTAVEVRVLFWAPFIQMALHHKMQRHLSMDLPSVPSRVLSWAHHLAVRRGSSMFRPHFVVSTDTLQTEFDT